MSKNQKNHQNVLEVAPNLIQNAQLNEQGRSMVEMLGVLAVVGVLSVGAISGYRYAMNKYRANQVTNELNLLSHQVGIAMMSKNGVTGELKLGDPYDTSSKLTSAGYEMIFGCGETGTDTPCQNQNLFHFEVKDVSEGVCKELLQMREHMQFIKSQTDICAAGNTTLNYVFELPEASSGSAGETSPDPAEEGSEPRCEGAHIWSNGEDTGECCPSDTPYWNGIECEACPEGYPKFMYDVCMPEDGCRVNDDCDDDQYCVNRSCGYTCTQEFGGDDENQHYGECRSVVGDTKTITLTLGGSEKTVKASTQGLTWWAANRFCERLEGNYHLVSLSDLNCTSSGCNDWGTLNTKFSGSNGIYGTWTTDDGSATCQAYYVYFYYSSVSSNGRYSADIAVCVE